MRRRLRYLRGVLTDAQAERLQGCARVLRAPGRIVVAGHRAASAAHALAAAAPEGVAVVPVAPDALDAVDGPIDVLYVGGAGRYTAALEALERWGARVVPGGTLFVQGAFHSPPVTAALLRSVGQSPGWRYSGRTGSLAEYTRADLMRGERVLDGVGQLAQLPSFARAVIRRRRRR